MGRLRVLDLPLERYQMKGRVSVAIDVVEETVSASLETRCGRR